jgi:ABC-type multidrug transport system ATPase subunit
MLMRLSSKKKLGFAGLDARAAAVVMRVVRSIADTGRTITCTIHQPSIDIFEVGELS